MREFEFEVAFQIRRIGVHWCISGYTRTVRFIYKPGVDYSMRTEATLQNIGFDPGPGDLQPALSIPEGTAVHIRNAPEILAKWSGGKVVMGYNKATVSAIAANWDTERPSPPWRRPLVVTTMAALAVAACVLAWRVVSRRAA